MARHPKVWTRKGRGYYTTIRGQQIPLGDDRKEAQRLFAELVAADAPILPGRHTVAQLVDLFLADCDKRVVKGEMSAETVKSYRSYLTRWAAACRRVMPRDLRPRHLLAWIETHPSWNSTSAADAICRVKIWYRWAIPDYIDLDRLSNTRSPTRLTRDAADPADLLRFEQAITEDRFRDWFLVLRDTGCRPGELRRLAAADVDFQRSSAAVTGKTGERIVGLSPLALGILQRCAEEWTTGPLLRTERGAAWSQSNIKHTWRKWRLVSGVPASVKPYHMRHDLHRRWSNAGVTDIRIAAQFGHMKRDRPHLGLILSTYGHVEGATLAEAARAVERFEAHEQEPSTHQRRQG
jgi:integrase